MTTVLLGPAPCASCGTFVTVVRRPVMIRGVVHGTGVERTEVAVPSEELREVVVLAGDAPHACHIARTFDIGYDGGAEYSGAPDIMHTATRPARRLYSDAAGRVHSGVQTE